VGEKKGTIQKGKERSRSQENKAIFGDFISLLFKQRDGGMGYAKKNRETPNSPSSFLFLLHCDCLEGRLKPGGPPSKRRAVPRLSSQHLPFNARNAKSGHTHGGNDGDHSVLSIVESVLNLLTEVSVGDLDIVLGVSVTVHQVEETLLVSRVYLIPSLDATHILNVDELVFGSGDVGDIHVVGLSSVFPPFVQSRQMTTHGGRDILELLTGEDLFR